MFFLIFHKGRTAKIVSFEHFVNCLCMQPDMAQNPTNLAQGTSFVCLSEASAWRPNSVKNTQ
jgi:hypothetical protein